MKRLLLVVFALASGLGWTAQAAYEYDTWIYGPVSVTNLSVGSSYRYQLDFKQVGQNSSGTNFQSEASIVILPSSPSITGTFSIAENTIDKSASFVYYNGAYRYAVDYSSAKYTEITIADNGNGSYTLSGTLRTKNGSTYYYYYYSGTTTLNYDNAIRSNTFDIFGAEPSKTAVTFNSTGKQVAVLDYVSSDHRVLVDIYNSSFDLVELSIVSSKFELPAGTYNVATNGGNGSIAAATGMTGGYYPEGSYLNYNLDNYFITGGSVAISYSQDNSSIIFNGNLTTAHGTTVSISASCDNPFYKEPEPEPQAINLTVSSVTALFNEGTKPNFELSIGAKNGEAPCNGYIRLYTEELAGTFDYNNIYAYSYMGRNKNEEFNYLDTSSPAHSVKIEATGKANEYKLNSSLVCEDKNTYVIKDFIFTYIPPTPVGPWDAEEETAETKSFTTAATPYIHDGSSTGNGITLQYYDNEFNTVYLTFAVNSLSGILPGRYIVSDTKVPGTLIASEGRHIGKTDADTYETYTYYGKGFNEDPYYITGGYVDVTFSGSSMLIAGVVTTHAGSTITLDITSNNKGEGLVCANPLPVNVMNGYLLGTSATYMFAYDVTTDAEGKIRINGHLSTSEPVSGLKAGIKVKDSEAEMTYETGTGRCYVTCPVEADRGDVVEISLSLEYTGGATALKTIKYTVE